MSDIAVVEIAAPAAIPETSPPNEVSADKSESKQAGKWARTRLCCCPDTAGTDCRYHSPSEPGWETCPWEKRAGRGQSRWLWASTGGNVPVSDEDLSVGAEIKELTKAERNAGNRFLH